MGVGDGLFIATACDGIGRPLDPLTCEWWHDLQPFRWGCTCGAPNCAMHSEDCGVTPIYASVVPPSFQVVIGSFHVITAAVTQTVIKCAICKKERLGKDLIVVYECRESGPVKQLKNMRMAVCPEHNRTGTIGYQRALPRGY